MAPPRDLREFIALLEREGELVRLQKLKTIADSRPKTVRRAPCQEVVLEGDDALAEIAIAERRTPDAHALLSEALELALPLGDP